MPPGAAGPVALLAPLVAALDGSGPAVAPTPTVTAQISNDYVMSLLAAVRPDSRDEPLESDEIAVVMATSGSTGNPHGVLLTAAQLTSMTAAVHGTARPQWIAALPVTSMGGLNVLVRAIAADRPPIALPSLGGAAPFTPAAFHDAVSAATAVCGDVRVSLVPAQLSRLLSDDAGISALRACTSILVGGAATRPSLLTSAAELGVSVTTTYGSTETSGGCVFDGLPLPGVFVAASATQGAGVLTITGPCVAAGYRGEPALTRERFGPGRYLTTDIGFVSDSGLVTVVGRADDVVVVKGVNVSPGAVERAVADLPDVVSAAAVTIEDEAGDPLIVCFLEVRDSAAQTAGTALAAIVTALGPAARPSAIHEVPHLPHLPNGKVDRRLLQEWARTRRRADQ